MLRNLSLVFICFLFLFSFRFLVSADSTCTITVNQTTVPLNQQVTLTWTLTNTGSSPLVWVRFTLPRNSTFSNISGSADNWSVTQVNSRDIRFMNGRIDPGNSDVFATTTTTGSYPFTNIYWTIYGADVGDGTTAVVCSGIPALSSGDSGPTATPAPTQTPTHTPIPAPTEIQNSPTPPIEGPTDTITQTPTPTSESSSLVQIQTPTPTQSQTIIPTPFMTSTPSIPPLTVLATDKKGPIITVTQPTNNLITNEKILQFKGTANDDSGIISISLSQTNGQTWEPVSTVTGLLSPKTTFATTIAPTTDGIHLYRIKAVDAAGNSTISSPLAITIDRQGPKIVWYTQPSKVYTHAPSLTVHIEDTAGIEAVGSTIDQIVWTPLPLNLNQPLATDVTFTPPIVEDGSYSLGLQAVDTLGNTTVSEKKTIAIDTMPPGFGPQILHMGSFVLPTAQGSQFIPLDTQFSYTLQTQGGVNQLKMTLQNTEESEKITYLLSRTTIHNVWTTPLSLPKTGAYTMSIEGTDDAGNITKTVRPSLIGIPRGFIRSKDGPIIQAQVTLSVYDPTYQTYKVWDGSLYNQSNPQVTIEDGGYVFSVPPGTYSIAVQAKGYQQYQSQPFTILDKSFLTSDITLTKELPFPLSIIKPASKVYEKPRSFKNLVFTPSEQNGKIVGPLAKLFGTNPVPEYLVFIAWWHPDTPSLMLLLDKLFTQGKSISVILPNISENAATVWKQRGSWATPVIPDTEGILIPEIGIHWVPFAIHLGPSGTILQKEWDLLPITRMIEKGGI